MDELILALLFLPTAWIMFRSDPDNPTETWVGNLKGTMILAAKLVVLAWLISLLKSW